MKKNNSTLLFLLALIAFPVSAQENPTNSVGDKQQEERKERRAWEFGLGGTALKLTRFCVTNFDMNANKGYTIDASKKDALFGGELYVARELNPHFYIDLQGIVNYANDRIANNIKDDRWIASANLGLQYRLGEYFEAKYIDPFLRIGAGYMYKNFNVRYNGMEQLGNDDMNWDFTNIHNKDGDDKKHLIPIAAGAGVNMWLNDHWGIGMQADYLVMPHANVANSWQGAVRLIYRIGGKSKAHSPKVHYVERIVEKPTVIEKIIEKPTIVEKIVETPGVQIELFDLLEGVNFSFDRAEITHGSLPIIEKIAKIIKQEKHRKFLITGCTDARGSESYNRDLSRRRAAAVVSALAERGVPRDCIKSRGVGKSISYAPATATDNIRRGDRKIMIEVVSNMDYWNWIP